MAATSAMSRSPESEKNTARRPENYPSRETWKPGTYNNFGPLTLIRRFSEEMDRVFAHTFGLSRNIGESGLTVSRHRGSRTRWQSGSYG